MKLIIAILLLSLPIQVMANITKIESSKDWSAFEIETHEVSGQEACVAKTSISDKDIHLEVYSSSHPDGGFVQPMVQIVGTDLPPAVGSLIKFSTGGKEFPMSISLNETKKIEVEILEEGAEVPVLKEVEQQVFVVKFDDKSEIIQLIRAKNNVKATFVSATGDVAEETFSLRGSSKTVRAMLAKCL